MRPSARTTVAALATTLILISLPTVAMGHGNREVGDYEFTVGFFVEPAYEGQLNGVDLRVGHRSHQGGDRHGDGNDSAVLGLESTLQVEVIHTESGASTTLPLRPVWGQPGRYTADVVPTATGAYTFRFFGMVESLDVDESFTSTEDSFSSVEPITELQFPEQVVSGRQLQAAVSGASNAATAAEDAAAAATTRANIALAVGALGLIVGIGGIAFGLRQRAA